MPPPGTTFKLKLLKPNSQTIRPTSTTVIAEPAVHRTPLDGALTLASSGAGVEPVWVGSSTPKVEKGFVAGVRRSSHCGAAATTGFTGSATEGITVVELEPRSPSSASKSSSATSISEATSSAVSRLQAVVAFGDTTGVARVSGEPFTAAIRCSRNSSALWNLSSRSLASARSTTASSSAEIESSNCEGGSTGSETCW